VVAVAEPDAAELEVAGGGKGERPAAVGHRDGPVERFLEPARRGGAGIDARGGRGERANRLERGESEQDHGREQDAGELVVTDRRDRDERDADGRERADRRHQSGAQAAREGVSTLDAAQASACPVGSLDPVGLAARHRDLGAAVRRLDDQRGERRPAGGLAPSGRPRCGAGRPRHEDASRQQAGGEHGGGRGLEHPRDRHARPARDERHGDRAERTEVEVLQPVHVGDEPAEQVGPAHAG
jgi:hypothetical protein